VGVTSPDSLSHDVSRVCAHDYEIVVIDNMSELFSESPDIGITGRATYFIFCTAMSENLIFHLIAVLSTAGRYLSDI
jgi:hypothetical protein